MQPGHSDLTHVPHREKCNWATFSPHLRGPERKTEATKTKFQNPERATDGKTWSNNRPREELEAPVNPKGPEQQEREERPSPAP